MKVPWGSLVLGQRFGTLTVVGEAEYHYGNTQRRRQVTCVCDCGAVRTVWVENLNKGVSTSCGAPRKHREAIERKKQEHEHHT